MKYCLEILITIFKDKQLVLTSVQSIKKWQRPKHRLERIFRLKNYAIMVEDSSEREILLLSNSKGEFSLYDADNDTLYEDIEFFKQEEKTKIPFFLSMIGTKFIWGVHNSITNESEAFSSDLETEEKDPIGPVDWDININPVVVNDFIYYSTKNDIWSIEAESKEVSACANFEHDHYAGGGKVNETYYAIGCVSCEKTPDPKSCKDVICESYDIQTEEVKCIASIPLTETKNEKWWTRKLSACEFDGKLHVIDESTLENIYIYTPEDDQWEKVSVKSPPPISSGILIACNGKLICVDDRCMFNTFDFDSGRWKTITHHNGALLNSIDGTYAVSAAILNYWNLE